MTELRRAAELALEALIEDVMVEVEPNVWEYKSIVAIQALRQALGTEQEGCAQCGKQSSKGWALYCVECVEGKREWVELSDDELEDLEFASVDREYGHLDVRVLSQAIEAKLKAKNESA